MKEYIKLIRLKHWIKNLLIFLPLICSKDYSIHKFIVTFLAFLSFSFMSSVIYIINDIKDKEKDKLHPRKKNRPIASGKIKSEKAIIVAIFLFLISITLNLISTNIFSKSILLLLAYFIINLGYSLGLKNIAILDVTLLASGFILRVYYGATICNIEVSNWLFLTILSASFYMGLGKRGKEYANNKDVRGVLKDYDETFINDFMNITLALIIVFYSLWAMEQTNKYIIFSVPLLIIIFMEYSLIMKKSEEGDPITILFKNKSLILTVFLYIVVMFLGIVVF